jgi:ABC-type tungstate transport system substrate-binding protein
MATDVGAINVAIAYGFLLIIIAVVLAFAYNHFCTRAEEMMQPEDDEEVI